MTRTIDRPVLVAFGANLPDGAVEPARTVAAAIAALAGEGLEIMRRSRLYATPAFPAGNGPDYVNAAAEYAAPAGMDAAGILAICHRVETIFGRVRAARWGQRTLDADLLAVGSLVLPDPETFRAWHDLPPADQPGRTPEQLILPHPRLHERAFVLVPLAEIAPGWIHPVTGQSVAAMLAALPRAEVAAVRAIAPAAKP